MTARLVLVLAVLAGCTITPADAAPTQTAPVSGLLVDGHGLALFAPGELDAADEQAQP